MHPLLRDLRVKIFADGANLHDFARLAENPLISGYTTNPTLMRKAGVTDYAGFAKELLEIVPEQPVSFEVFADDPDEMARQARHIASWGENVYVKIPITNSEGESCTDLLATLAADGIRVNATALMTVEQVESAAEALEASPASFISLFAGRIADTGRDPVPMIRDSVGILEASPHLSLIWASPREILNVFQANEAGCHVITVTTELLGKLPSVGKDLETFSVETVRMFYDDACAAGYSLDPVLSPD